MPTINQKLVILARQTLSLFFLSLFCLPAFAVTNYYFTEGNENDGYWKVYLELEPGLVADILSDKWRISSDDMKWIKELKEDYKDLQIYSLHVETTAATEEFLRQAGPGIAPVFKSAGGNYQVVTGEVNVFFNIDLQEDLVIDFFAGEGIGISQINKLNWGKNGYQVSVAPGLPALDLVNRLRIYPQVGQVYPNFWRTGYELH